MHVRMSAGAETFMRTRTGQKPVGTKYVNDPALRFSKPNSTYLTVAAWETSVTTGSFNGRAAACIAREEHQSLTSPDACKSWSKGSRGDVEEEAKVTRGRVPLYFYCEVRRVAGLSG